jgi:hypothetical protein
MNKEQCVCQLNSLANLANNAAVAAASNQWAKVTDILQGQMTPLLQQVAHDTWLKHHQSGVGKV